MEAEELDTPIDFGKKKSKKVPKPPTLSTPAEGQGQGQEQGQEQPQEEPDYTYDFLLKRVYDQLERSGVSIRKGNYKLPPPVLASKGSARVCFMNFADICVYLNRPVEHLSHYICVETGSPNSLDKERKKLVIKGKYDQRKIESILAKYMKDYVVCTVCKSQSTVLEKEERLNYVKCQTCSSKVSVAKIEKGYVHVTKRKMERA